MKILQVMAGGEHGGAETAFIDMCVAMKEAGEEIEAVTRLNARNARLKEAGIKTHLLPFGGGIDIYTPWAIKKIIRKFRPDIVQTWMSRAAAKTPRWAPEMNIPRYKTVARLGNYYNVKYFKNADFFITITPAIKTYLEDHGIDGNRVRHINNFAETESLITPVRRSDFATPEEATVLLALGRLHEAKAFDTLIKAVGELPGVYLWIAGEGPDRPGLESLIADKELGARVKLLGWRDDRAALFDAADICVFPSRYEPFGTVFAQAWAHKTPLIASDADGPRQFVHPGRDGLIFPIDDVPALARAIHGLAADKSLQTRFVENGYARYLNEFSKETTVAAYLGWYREIIQK